MSRQSLSVQVRDASGKSPVAKRLRKTGRVPGVLYRRNESMSFSVDELELNALLRHGATLVDVDVDGTKHPSIVKDYQVHPVRGSLMHIDLQEVDLTVKIATTVPLVLTGEPEGVKRGGVLGVQVHELNIESVPTDIPDSIELDVSALGVGDSINLDAVVMPSGVVLLDDLDTLVASIAASRASRSLGSGGSDDGEGGEGDEGGEGAADAAPAAE